MAYRRSALMEERLAGNRERILHAARALIAEGGYRNAPVTAVAAAAGVSTGQIYRHFPSKAELFVEVLNAAVQREMTILRAIITTQASAAERLRNAITTFVRRALAGPALACVVIMARR
ncbi:TetR/AcrR family transcriptional regulator, partial [Xanthomonas fragariae]|uniref:TetR/AcrR family transcriptional regulator n=2 Tax=Xanthomonas fragariae TaxID=48664 RepID=UPI00131F454E